METAIQNVVICNYRGAYTDYLPKVESLFDRLRKARGGTFKITKVPQERLVDTLDEKGSSHTLLVVPAGPSGELDDAFSSEETESLQKRFFEQGGRGMFICGAAYWTCQERTFSHVKKLSKLPLFEGCAIGPLCPSPERTYNVDFYHDAVEVAGKNSCCTVYLSGGGCFLLSSKPRQQVRVLARYKEGELKRINASQTQENAAIMVSVGKGAAALIMFHPEFQSEDIDLKACEATFPKNCREWAQVQKSLSPLNCLVTFFERCIFTPLETIEF